MPKKMLAPMKKMPEPTRSISAPAMMTPKIRNNVPKLVPASACVGV